MTGRRDVATKRLTGIGSYQCYNIFVLNRQGREDARTEHERQVVPFNSHAKIGRRRHDVAPCSLE